MQQLLPGNQHSPPKYKADIKVVFNKNSIESTMRVHNQLIDPFIHEGKANRHQKLYQRLM